MKLNFQQNFIATKQQNSFTPSLSSFTTNGNETYKKYSKVRIKKAQKNANKMKNSTKNQSGNGSYFC